ncbi:MAG: long-chain fatty acid--CoA ligase [Blastocatellia bacterium]|nr:long-chain fatty acid--CoA ligase [Blastocatellia bacterium]
MPQEKPRTINECMAHAIRSYRKDNAFSYKKDGKWIAVSHDAFATLVREARAGFLKLGVNRGDRVGLLSENRLEWTATDLALLSCGGVNVPIYATSTGPQIAYILNDAGARILCVSSAKQLDKVTAVIDTMPGLEKIVCFDVLNRPAGLPNRVQLVQYEELRRMGESSGQNLESFLDEMVKSATPDDLATLIYTSGTTGEPKGVMLTHSNIASNIIAASLPLSCGPDDSALSYLPLSHIFERTVMYFFIYSGVTVYYAESVDAVRANLVEVKPTVMTSVPRVFEKILDAVKTKFSEPGGFKTKLAFWALEVGKECAKLANEGIKPGLGLSFKKSIAEALVLSKVRENLAPRIKFFASGGAALSFDVALSFHAFGWPILQGYGLTETSPVIAMNSPSANRYGTVGKPVQDCEVKIASDGEILAKGPNIMRGYYNRPEATAEAIKDGWFHTGDIGEFDKDGFLKITDRKKDLFKTSGGKYIAPQPIENKLVASPLILQAVIIGNERKFPAALIVPNKDAIRAAAQAKGVTFKSDAEMLRDNRVIDMVFAEVTKLTPDLASWEKIKRIGLLDQELTLEGGELTPTLKVKRRVVDQKYKNIIERIYDDKSPVETRGFSVLGA